MMKYDRAKTELVDTGFTTMKAFGSSMMPVIKSGSTLRFQRCETYQVKDIVFCKVKGRYIEAHWITAIDNQGRYMIANNHGHENGWTKQVYGKVVKIL